ncbi:MAG: alpha/beta hydrolase [Pirellulales bacterium]
MVPFCEKLAGLLEIYGVMTMRISRVTLSVVTALLMSWSGGASWSEAAEPQEVVAIWPGVAPDEPTGSEGAKIGEEYVRMSPELERKQVEVTESTRMITNVTRPTLTIFPAPAEHRSRAAVIICPGGGYWDLYWQLEGEEVAEWLNSIGVTGVILKYRVPRRAGEPEELPARRPLQDAQRAISLVRQRAKDWGLDQDKIGIIGFSAGGHLAIAAATESDRRTYDSIDATDEVSCRPDFAISVYPGYLKARDRAELAPYLRIPPTTPPVFLVHGGDDIISSPEHSLLMYQGLKQAGIPAELHIYSGTTHDFGVRPSDRPYGGWTQACAKWMHDQGWIGATGPSQPATD